MARFEFDDCVLDLDRFELHRAGELVSVEPKVFDVLAYLVENAGRIVPKRELIDHLWGDSFVSESALTTRLASAREAVGDDGRAQRVIRTVHRRGYELVATVTPAQDDSKPGVEPEGTGGGEIDRVRPPAKSLVGRADDVREVTQRLAPGKLVTVVGPAGVGKTHLVHHVAGYYGTSFPDGSFLVSLASVRNGDAVAQAVLDAIGRPRQHGTTAGESVAHAAEDMRALLVLDNCEHVLTPVVDLLRPILAATPAIAVLATSRRRLGLAGERLVPLRGLTPTASAELLMARADDHGVTLDVRSPVVGEVCEVLDHLPLALELASAQVRVLGLETLATLLDDRLRLLEASNEVDAHHRTLEMAIASSFEDLEPALAHTIGRFSQFAGTFDLAAAVALARAGRQLDEVDAVRHVVELAERSLIVIESGDDTIRYRLLESIRLFAAARLDTPNEARSAHLRHFCEVAQRRDTLCGTPEFEGAWTELGADWSNYRAAVGYGIELGLVDETFALLRATVGYAELSQRLEHQEWAERALAAATAESAAVRTARAGIARLLATQGRHAEVAALAEAAGEPDEDLTVALAHFWASWGRGQHSRAEELLGILDDHVRGTGGLYELTVQSLRQTLATFAGAELGDADERTVSITEAGGPVSRVFVWNMRVRQSLRAGEPERALAACRQMLSAAEASGMQIYASAALLNRAYALQSLDRVDVVAREIRAGLEYQSSVGYWTAVRPDAGVAAKLLVAAGNHVEAAEILGGCERQSYRGHGTELIDELTSAVEEQLGDAFGPAFDRGLRLSAAELCSFAIDQLTLLIEE